MQFFFFSVRIIVNDGLSCTQYYRLPLIAFFSLFSKRTFSLAFFCCFSGKESSLCTWIWNWKRLTRGAKKHIKFKCHIHSVQLTVYARLWLAFLSDFVWRKINFHLFKCIAIFGPMNGDERESSKWENAREKPKVVVASVCVCVCVMACCMLMDSFK